MVEFNEDDTKVTVGGHRYRAEPGPVGSCNGCAMKQGFGCLLTESVLRLNRGLRGPEIFGASKCSQHWRADGRSIIWVLDV